MYWKTHDREIVKILYCLGCEAHVLFSREYWQCHVSHVSLTMYHPVGTCKMGQDASSVVDENLRVRGVSGKEMLLILFHGWLMNSILCIKNVSTILGGDTSFNHQLYLNAICPPSPKSISPPY